MYIRFLIKFLLLLLFLQTFFVIIFRVILDINKFGCGTMVGNLVSSIFSYLKRSLLNSLDSCYKHQTKRQTLEKMLYNIRKHGLNNVPLRILDFRIRCFFIYNNTI